MQGSGVQIGGSIMNKSIFTGNLTRDPEIRYSQGTNMAVAHFGIAVNRKFAKDGETDTDFFNCTAFGKTAEFIEKYFHKGSRIFLTGRVQNDNYTNKNGEKVYSVQIIVEDVEFGEKKNAQAPASDNSDDDFVKIPEGQQGDIPFFNQN
jgi:single-strand DNA-binding protein